MAALNMICQIVQLVSPVQSSEAVQFFRTLCELVSAFRREKHWSELPRGPDKYNLLNPTLTPENLE